MSESEWHGRLWEAVDHALGHASGVSGIAGTARDVLGRPLYDNRRGTPGYEANHFVAEVPEGEEIVRSYPGTISRHGQTLPAVIHETNADTILVDTYRMPRPPSHAALSGAALDAVGLREARRLPAGTYHRHEREGRIDFEAGATQIRGMPELSMGRIADLPPGEQLRQAWRLARGR